MTESQHLFKIKDFHAIEHADILLNGITVLAGINGCGKSTIARSLFSIINSLNEFDRIQRSKFVNNLKNEIAKIGSIFPLGRVGVRFRRNGYLFKQSINNLSTDLDFIAEISTMYLSFVNKISEDLRSSHDFDFYMGRAYKYLIDEMPEGRGVEYLIERYKNKSQVFLKEQVRMLKKSISERSLESFLKVIREEYPDCDVCLSNMIFYEDDIALISNDRCLCPLALKNAIYIDTPMVLSVANDYYDDKNIWQRFLSLMHTKNDAANFDKTDLSTLIHLIKITIAGDIVEATDFGQKELHYKTKGGLDINIRDTATGIKSFAYILRLLENGWLNKQSLLIIDEPEAHLHPQWIVEFAKVLVLLNKELEVKILVASHNPDMVAAIHDMAVCYKLLDNTNFYIAEENEENSKFNFRHLGCEIGDIFESFNVALTKINEYSI